MNGKADGRPGINLAAKFREILGAVWSHKFLVLLFMILAMIQAYVKLTYYTADVYTTSGILYVSNRSDETKRSQLDNTVYGSDLNASRTMSTTYIEILKMRSFLEQVSEATGGKYSAGQIGGMVSVAPLNSTSTEMLRVSVRGGSADSVYEVAEAYLATAPSRLGFIFEGGEVKVIEDAVMPSAPSKPDVKSAMFRKMLIGMALGCALAIVLDYFDNKIHRSDDIVKRYHVSILGEISR